MSGGLLEVDLKGLSQLIEDAGPTRLLWELVRNSLDEDGVTVVRIELAPVPGVPLVRLSVVDDAPEGFRDLSHAYTLFASSYKKDHPEKAGRFNMGDKLFLAASLLTRREVVITSTTGSVSFSLEEGRKYNSRARTEQGSAITGYLRATRDQYDEMLRGLRRLLLPPGVWVMLNGVILPSRMPFRSFQARLATVQADQDGVLRYLPGGRETTVEAHEVLDGEEATLYELGVPVVATGDTWHLNVLQKVPLNMDRDNVTPAYLRSLRTLTLNALRDDITPAEAASTWVQEAIADERVSREAIGSVLDLRFGPKRVSHDMSDPEANKRAIADGFVVVTGGALNRDQWARVKQHQAIQPAGRLFPSPKPYSDDPDAECARFLPEQEWTEGMRFVARYARWLHQELLELPLLVRVLSPVNKLMHFGACYSKGELHFNLVKLGHSFFSRGVTEELDKLLIHEFGHFFSGDHLSDEYYDGLCLLGARLKRLALQKPQELRAAMRFE